MHSTDLMLINNGSGCASAMCGFRSPAAAVSEAVLSDGGGIIERSMSAMPAIVDPPPEPAPPSQLSPVARRHLAANGRRLYVWEQRRRRWWLVSSTTRIAISMDPPAGVAFNPPTRMDGIDVHLDSETQRWFAGHPYAVVDVTGRKPRFVIAHED